MENQITKYDETLKKLEESIRFYIKDEKSFAEALIFAKKLENFAEMIKEKVRNRGSEIMSKDNLKEIIFGDFKVLKVEPPMRIEYRPGQVIEALGMENSLQFLKVDATKLKGWIIKARVEGETLNTLNLGRKEKLTKGYIKLIPITKEYENQ